MGIYANWLLPTYCMFTVRERDIVVSTVVITGRMIEEFRCADGRIGIVWYDRFKRLLNRKVDSGNDISPHRPFFTGPCSKRDKRGIPLDLVIKRPNMRTNASIESSGRNRSNGTLRPTRTTLTAKTKGTFMQGWT